MRRIPAQRPVTLSFDDFFDLRLNKQLNKQSKRWWFETPSCPQWRHCNEKGVSFVQLSDFHTSFTEYLGVWYHRQIKLCGIGPFWEAFTSDRSSGFPHKGFIMRKASMSWWNDHNDHKFQLWMSVFRMSIKLPWSQSYHDLKHQWVSIGIAIFFPGHCWFGWRMQHDFKIPHTQVTVDSWRPFH